MLVRSPAPFAAALVYLFATGSVQCADEIKPDAVKYPQDTPEHALDSIAKAIEAKELGYWIAHLVTPDHTQRMIEKYKSIEAAVAANIDDPKKVEGRKHLLEAIRAMQADKKTSEGEENGKKWFRFMRTENEFIQLEKQADGRWCMNPRARAKTQETEKPKESEKK
jgi:hypothetical protein